MSRGRAGNGASSSSVTSRSMAWVVVADRPVSSIGKPEDATDAAHHSPDRSADDASHNAADRTSSPAASDCADLGAADDALGLRR